MDFYQRQSSEPGLMGLPSDSSQQQTHTSCSYQHSPGGGGGGGAINPQNSLSNNQANSHSTASGQVPLSHPAQPHPAQPHPGHGSPHAQHLPPHAAAHNPHGQHAPHAPHPQQHPQHPQHPSHPQQGQHPSHGQHPQHPQQQQQQQHAAHPSQHTQHSQHPPQHGQQQQQQQQQQQHPSLSHQPHPTQQQMACNTGLLSDWYPNLDALKESCRIASSYNWADVDLSPFQGLRESMRQAELNNWSLEPTQIADLCSSINQFFARTGVIGTQGAVPPPVCHSNMHPNKPGQHLNTGNLYMDSRQSMSMMGPPGYPHMAPMNSAGPTMTGHHAQMNPQHMIPIRNFPIHRLPPDEIQDDFDWDLIA